MALYTATLEQRFKASHDLDDLFPIEHSHEWIFRLTLASNKLTAPGIIVDYFRLKQLVEATLPPAGTNLSTWEPLQSAPPTAENLAQFFYQQLKPQLPQLTSVSVGEFPEFICTYCPE